MKIFEPTTFPIAISSSFFLAATIDVTSSGSEVPRATIVRPTKVSDIPNLSARVVHEATTQSPPYLIATAPPII